MMLRPVTIHYLLPDPDVLLLDQHASVVDRLGKSQLENLKKQT